MPTLESRLGYCFNDRSLLQQALTHPSCTPVREESSEHNQRLEFLGDAVLGLLLADQLYRERPDDEGGLTILRSRCASGRSLARLARTIDLGSHLLLGAGARREALHQQPRTLAAAFEALLGAAWLDGGLPAVQQIYDHLIRDHATMLQRDPWADNPKGELQAWLQSESDELPCYELLSSSGPDHAPSYTVSVTAAGHSATGRGPNKRDAETAAAARWLELYR